jgi:chloride channel, nucleotide-sensitive, 1A
MIRFGAVNTDEEIVYTNGSCRLKINNANEERGELLLTNRFVYILKTPVSNKTQLSFRFSEICWKTGPESGFMIPWDKITVQAITQEPRRCIYFMIDVSWPLAAVIPINGAANGNGVIENPDQEAQNESEDEGNDSEGSVQELTEFHIIPDRNEDVDEIYYIMTKFPAAEDMDEDSDDDDFFDGENMDQMNLNENDDDRFADAE